MPTPRSSRNRQTQKEDLTVKLIHSFKTLINNGTLTARCKLPPERELARLFGVSRNSLRQALKVLEIMGVVSQRVGDGTYLSDGASVVLAQPLEFLFLMDGISYQELFDARAVVEPEAAARAAERATTDDLLRLRRTLEVFKDRTASLQQVVQADLDFHDAIFRSAGNRMFRMLFGVVHQALLSSVTENARRGSVRDTLRYHTAVYQAIAARKPVEARRAMAEHIREAREALLGDNPVARRVVKGIQPISRKAGAAAVMSRGR